MPPTKKSSTAAKPKASSGSHASYQDMIKMAIVNLKDRKGSSRQAIKKYIKANNKLGSTTEAAFNSHINRALATGEETGVFERPKGPSGPIKLKKPESSAKPAASKPAAKPASKPAVKPAVKPTVKKSSAASKTKKPTEKKPKAVKKVAPKAKPSTAPKAKAAAPAVDNKPAIVTGKTKSGRVTKSKAPQSTVKKTAPKKTTTKKPAKKETKKE